MMRLGDAISTIQALLGDPKGQWVKRGYVLPILNITYAAVNLNLKNASGKNLEAVVPILNVPAGTTSLYKWQQATARPGDDPGKMDPQPLLRGLTDVIEIYVKPAGASVFQYTRISERDTLPHVDPNLTTNNTYGSGMYWSMLGNKLLITPVNQPLDIEVTGKFNPGFLKDDEDLLTSHEDVWIPTCYKTAATAGVERSNPTILQGYADQAIASEDNLIAQIIRQGQGAPARFQRISREGGTIQWFWGI
jgi:hypothetical protein